MPSRIRLTEGALLAQPPERSSRRAAATSARAGVLAAAAALSLTASAGPAAAERSSLPPQLAYAYGENETPRAAAFGGALRALGNGTSAVFLNPSAMVETRVYHLQGLFQGSPEAGRHTYGGAVVDSVTGKLAGGISFVGGFVDAEGVDRQFLDARVGLAYPITERFFVGLTGRYAKITQDGTPPAGGLHDSNGEDPVSGGLIEKEDGDVVGRHSFVNELTFDAAITVKPTDNLYIAAVGQNLSYPDHGLLPTTIGGGVGFGTPDFSVEVDGLVDLNSYRDTTYRLMAGGEYLVADHFPLRAGYRFDQGADQHALSLGVAYVGTQFSVEGALRRALAGGGPTTFVVGLSYHLESSGLTRASSDGF
ncbi:porin family protein [Sorangium cellulosum]|nr:porin family protein [Sorangium cellulosum]